MKQQLTTKNLADTRTHAHTPVQVEASSINVLIACEESQRECMAFLSRGFNAFSCDVQPCLRGGMPERHIHGDVTRLLHGATEFITQDGKGHHIAKWHLIIAHPPCTYLCKVSSVLLKSNVDYEVPFDGGLVRVNRSRYQMMLKARAFFFECLNAEASFVAVENPLPMRIAGLPRPSCFVEPFWFGVKYSKKTCYWTKNLPPIMPTVFHSKPRCFVTSSRGKYRSRTFPEVAEALATQWGDVILSYYTVD